VAFWDVAGPLGEPIRALRSAMNDSSLSVRDQLSDQWRVIENRNIAFTMRQLPLTGVGVGQAHLFHEQQVPVTFVYWRYITHNALMWLWLKAGPIGAFVLWFLVARVLLLGSALYLRLRDAAGSAPVRAERRPADLSHPDHAAPERPCALPRRERAVPARRDRTRGTPPPASPLRARPGALAPRLAGVRGHRSAPARCSSAPRSARVHAGVPHHQI